MTTATDRDDVWAVLDRQNSRPPALRWTARQPVVLAIDSEKGGVGKSGLAGGVVAVAAAAGLRVCAIDLDPRATLTAELAADGAEDALTVNDLLWADPALDPDDAPPLRGLAADALRPAGAAWGTTVQVLAAERALGNREMDATVGLEHRLRRSLEGVVEQFDVAVIDMPPRAGGKLVAAGLLAASHVIYPMTLNEDGLVGVVDARRTLRRMAETSPTVPVEVGVVPNIVEKRTRLGALYIDRLNEEMPGMVMSAAVPKRIIRQEARAAQVPITAANTRDARECVAGYIAVLNHVSAAAA